MTSNSKLDCPEPLCKVLLTAPTDQGRTFQCWAVTFSHWLDFYVNEMRRGPAQKVSAKYVVYMKTRDEVVRQILNQDFEFYVQGGLFEDALRATQNHGYLFEKDYPGAFPRSDAELFSRLNELIQSYKGRPRPRREVVRAVERVLDSSLGRPSKEKVRFLDAIAGKTAREFEVGLKGKPAVKNALLLKILDESIRQRKKPILLQYRVQGMDHYVLAVHVKLDNSGQIKAILVKNSWRDGKIFAGTIPGIRDPGMPEFRSRYPQYHWIHRAFFKYLSAIELSPESPLR